MAGKEPSDNSRGVVASVNLPRMELSLERGIVAVGVAEHDAPGAALHEVDGTALERGVAGPYHFDMCSQLVWALKTSDRGDVKR